MLQKAISPVIYNLKHVARCKKKLPCVTALLINFCSLTGNYILKKCSVALINQLVQTRNCWWYFQMILEILSTYSINNQKGNFHSISRLGLSPSLQRVIDKKYTLGTNLLDLREISIHARAHATTGQYHFSDPKATTSHEGFSPRVTLQPVFCYIPKTF